MIIIKYVVSMTEFAVSQIVAALSRSLLPSGIANQKQVMCSSRYL